MKFSDTLVEVLENPALIKAGIGLAADFLNLKKVFPFEPQNIIDLSLVAQRQGIKQSGVRNLAGQLLGFRITKGSSTSNWASPRLTPKQIAYAATDAWVCRELFLRFQQLGFLDLEARPLSKRIGERKGTSNR
jgi:ribonuclease D